MYQTEEIFINSCEGHDFHKVLVKKFLLHFLSLQILVSQVLPEFCRMVFMFESFGDDGLSEAAKKTSIYKARLAWLIPPSSWIFPAMPVGEDEEVFFWEPHQVPEKLCVY